MMPGLDHDDWCESEYVVGAAGYTDCGCAIHAVADEQEADRG